MNVIRNFWKESVKMLKFRYVKACLFSLVLFVVFTLLMFVCTEELGSFFCSISTGLFTGFVFFVISGLKVYDKESYEQIEKNCKICEKRVEEVLRNITEIAYVKDRISYSSLQMICLDIQECYIYYMVIVANGMKRNKTYREKATTMKLLLEDLKQQIGENNSLDESLKLHEDVSSILRAISKRLYIMKTDFSTVQMHAKIVGEELKLSRF